MHPSYVRSEILITITDQCHDKISGMDGDEGLEETVTVNTFQQLKFKFSFTDFSSTQQIVLDKQITTVINLVF